MLSGKKKGQLGPCASLRFTKDIMVSSQLSQIEQALQRKEFKAHPKSLLFVIAEIHLEAIVTNMYNPEMSADCRFVNLLVIKCHLPRPLTMPQMPNQWHLVSQNASGLGVHRSPCALTKLFRMSRKPAIHTIVLLMPDRLTLNICHSNLLVWRRGETGRMNGE